MSVHTACSGILNFGMPELEVPGGKGQNSQEQSVSCFGRAYRQLTDGIGVITNVSIVTECFQSVAKFLVCFAAAVHPKIFLEKLSVTMIQVDEFIDGVRVIADVRKLVALEFVDDLRKERYCSVLSDLSFLGADFGSAVSLLGFLDIVDTPKLAQAIGNVSVFGCKMPQIVPKIVVGTVSLHLQTIAFFWLGTQAAIDLSKGDDSRKNLLWIATAIAEVVHKVFLLFCAVAVTTTSGIVAAGVLGMVANGLGVWSAYEDVYGEPAAHEIA